MSDENDKESEPKKPEPEDSEPEESVTGESEPGKSEVGDFEVKESEDGEFEVEDKLAASEKYDDARIQSPLRVFPETFQTRGEASKLQPPSKDQETLSEEVEQSDEITSSSEESSSEKQQSESESQMEDPGSLHLKEMHDSEQSLTFLDQIKAAKESLKASMENSMAIGIVWKREALFLPLFEEIMPFFSLTLLFCKYKIFI